MSIGENIRSRRKVMGLSQEELSEKLNISRQSISKWEQDKSLPDLINGIKLCEFLGISTEELLGKRNLSKRNIVNESISFKYKKIIISLILFTIPIIFCQLFSYSFVYILIYYPFLFIGFLINNSEFKIDSKLLITILIGSLIGLIFYYLNNPLLLVFNFVQEVILVFIFFSLGQLFAYTLNKIK